MLSAVLCLALTYGGVSRGFAQQKNDGGWSADLLNQILKAEPAKPESVAPSPPVASEMVLHSYHLSHLRVGEAGKAQNVLAILNKLLPPGSSMNSDVPANTLHVLTTTAAHKAVWDYLSAVDVAETAAQPPAVVPDEVRTALKKLAETGDQSAKLATVIDSLKANVSQELAAIDARQRRQTLHLIEAGAGLAILLIIAIAWLIRRRSTPQEVSADTVTALSLAPDQLASALVPVHDKMRTDMLGLLNEVAIKLQAQHNEQQKLVREQQQQLEDARLALVDERRQFINEAGSMVVQAVERVDATTAKLARQQDKVAELVQELQNTVRELDETKDNLRDREIQLEQERAKIAALSLLLEEGAPLPSGGPNGHPPGVDAPNGFNHDQAADVPPRTGPLTPCTTRDQTLTTIRPSATPPSTAVPRFTFLPPEHPES